MDLFPKFIIEDGNLIIGKVTYHKELVTNKEKVQGGGWFKWSKDHETMIFYESSHDFGKASLEDIKECIKNDRIYDSMVGREFRFECKFAYDRGSEIIEL